MKTIKELHTEGKLSNRVYNAIFRGVMKQSWWFINYPYKYLTRDELNNMTPAELLNFFDEEFMLKNWSCFGPVALEELKSLV